MGENKSMNANIMKPQLFLKRSMSSKVTWGHFYVEKSIFSFLLNKVLVAARKHTTKREKLVLFMRLTFPKQSRKKIKQVLNFFSTLCFIASIKNNKNKYTREYCTVFVLRNKHYNFCALITNANPHFAAKILMLIS